MGRKQSSGTQGLLLAVTVRGRLSRLLLAGLAAGRGNGDACCCQHRACCNAVDRHYGHASDNDALRAYATSYAPNALRAYARPIDALGAGAAGLESVIHGPRYEPDQGPREACATRRRTFDADGHDIMS